MKIVRRANYGFLGKKKKGSKLTIKKKNYGFLGKTTKDMEEAAIRSGRTKKRAKRK